MKSLLSLISILLIITLQGCSNTKTHPDLQTMTIEQATQQHESLRGTKVFWGGTILNVKNFSHHSQLEILKRPLSGIEPDDRKQAQGRFLVVISGFIDPAEYKSPSRVTITGKLGGNQLGKVGSYPYTYPLVKADKVQLWQGQKEKPIRDPYGWNHSYPFSSPYYSRFYYP